MSMSSFPKPEKGVPRFELFFWSGEHWEWDSSVTTMKEARGTMREYARAKWWARAPFYIFDRRTGSVVATNEKQLEEKNVEA